jgi:hypothetical protein
MQLHYSEQYLLGSTVVVVLISLAGNNLRIVDFSSQSFVIVI